MGRLFDFMLPDNKSPLTANSTDGLFHFISQVSLIFLIGILGLIVLISAFFFAKTFFGENEEILFTVLGSMMVIYAHYKNHETCKEIQCNSCHD